MSVHIYLICWCPSLLLRLAASQYTDSTLDKACSLIHTTVALSEGCTSSRKTKKVTFLPTVATSVPSLVKSWRPLGAWLGHFCRLGLYFNRTPSVQLLDKALRYLEFIKDHKMTKRSTTWVNEQTTVCVTIQQMHTQEDIYMCACFHFSAA